MIQKIDQDVHKKIIGCVHGDERQLPEANRPFENERPFLSSQV
jgi:hypothetical protein